jgi:hypothetical protein
MNMENCIKECMECHKVCVETAAYLLHQQNVQDHTSHLILLADCAEICQISANFMLRRSDNHHLTCGICADICKRCEEECEKWPDDKQIRHCADICRSCFASCQAMAKA